MSKKISTAAWRLTARYHAIAEMVRSRWSELAAEPERGSESVEKAILVAIGLAVALGLGAAITAAVHKYQARLH